MTPRGEMPAPGGSIRYSLELDVGEVALGHRLVVRGISLTAERLFFDYAFVPGVTEAEQSDVFLNMFYDADVSPADWNYEDCWGPLEGGAFTEGDVHYTRPPLAARCAWFDFFRPDFVWEEHLGRRGPDADYLANRISRLTVDLRTGAAKVER
jgi:hypothetical protein